MTQLGLLSKLDILQTIPSVIISKINPAIFHNIGKYLAIKKAFYLSSIEEIEGDYFEFGVFTGSSFCHAVRCAKANERFDDKLKEMHFFGFDSFEGFGKLPESDQHRFYTDINFATNYEKVCSRVKKVVDESRFTLKKGYFEETLIGNSCRKSRIIFIDCDTQSSVNLALNHLNTSFQEGTILILDDYYSYRGSKEKGVAGAVSVFCSKNNIEMRRISSYGMGGVIMIINKLNNS